MTKSTGHPRMRLIRVSIQMTRRLLSFDEHSQQAVMMVTVTMMM